MEEQYFAEKWVKTFPEDKKIYQEHIADYEQLLGHIFFAEVLNAPLTELLIKNEDKAKIEKMISFMEEMYRTGNDRVRDIVDVTVIECLGDREDVLRNAFTYFSEELMFASKRMESLWGRRNIRIYWHRGKTLYEWEPPK